MTSIVNLFSNFNDLTKPKSVTDNVTDYKAGVKSCNEPSPALIQGTKFKKYQGKIANNLEKRIKNSDLVEGFEGLKDLDLNKNGLTEQTNNLLSKNDYASQQQTLSNLQNDYKNTLNEYQTLMSKVSGNVTNYIDRVNPNNPYLGKVIQLQGGALFYVTKQGVAKQILDMNIYTKVSGKNGFPPEGQFITVSLPWDNSYSSPGGTIPTNPPLVIGTPVEIGQSVGNEGVNVFLNSVVKTPQSSYVGCYNNLPPSTQVMFIPKMNSSNSVNGYKSYASSVYQNNNNFAGPWCAFDGDINTFWHSQVSASTNYDGKTGVYTGSNGWDYKDANGNMVHIAGEWLWLECGPGNILTKYDVQGRQGCCGNPSGRSPNSWVIIGGVYNESYELIDKRENESLNFEMKTYTVNNPKKYNHFIFLTTNCGNPGDKTGNRYCVQISTWNLYTSSNYDGTTTSAMTNAGQMNYEQCQNYALNSGNKYFGIQSVDNNGVGNCMTSNDLAGSQINGEAVNYKIMPLWDSKTYGNNPGSTMSFNNGSIGVLNSSGAAVFATPNDTAQPSNYIGCYKDNSKRAMPMYDKGRHKYNNESCQEAAETAGATYYGIQDSKSGQNAQCAFSSDLGQAQKYGLANNCTQLSDGSWSGGGWSNAIYSTTNPTNSYYLILQDDGNMCIYLGSSPNDNQGLVWSSNTNGKQEQPNPNFTAEKGKYGKNWISSSSTLAPGDFVGSTDGSIYLIMQTDGNLVLYTSTSSSKCSSSGGKTVGAQDANALYQLNQVGVSGNLAKLAYIDQDSQLHAYPSDNAKYSNTYTTMTGTDSQGNDISGAAYGNATVQQCQTSCNNNPDCAGFAFSNNVCYPKTSSMYPAGQMQVNPNVDLYVRNKMPSSPPIGVKNTTNNIDTLFYQNYVDGGAIDEAYGLSKASSVQKQQLQQMQTKMNLLSNQINNLTNQFSSGDQQVNQQSKTNIQSLDGFVRDIKNTNKKIKNYPSTNYENILQDSDIVVLQQNYDYLFWSIIAITTVIISMNIVKK
jgi:hypothetical protein